MINHNSSVPMYMQLANTLSEAVYQGKYGPGDKLPSENELCRRFNVSRITVRQALNLLIQQGMAFSVHGKGTFVKALDISHELNKIISFGSVLQQKGLKGHTYIQSYEEDVMDDEAMKRLGGPVSSLKLIGYADQTPVVFYCSYFPKELGEKMWSAAKEEEKTGNAFSTYDLYARLGIHQFRVDQTIRAANADPQLAKRLTVPKGKAVMVLESQYYSIDGRPLEYKQGYYRSDIYSFHLKRQI